MRILSIKILVNRSLTKIKQFSPLLDVFPLQKIYKIDKNVALATIIFLLIQYFFIVIKKTKTAANTPYKNNITFHTFSFDFYFEHLDSVSQSQFYFSLGLQKHYFFQ